MSTWFFGSLEKSRNDEASGDANKFVEILAALVPAEVLAIHALVMAAISELEAAPARTDLLIVFVGLNALCIALYCFASSDRKPWRCLIPSFAFTAWAMLQSPSAFDGLGWDLSPIMRLFIPLVIAVVISASIAPPARFRRKQNPPAGAQAQAPESNASDQAQSTNQATDGKAGE